MPVFVDRVQMSEKAFDVRFIFHVKNYTSNFKNAC